MTDPHDVSPEGTDPLRDLFDAQRRARARRRAPPDLAERLDALTRLRDAITARRAEIVAALAEDFGKPETETVLTEILPVLQDIRTARRQLKGWMRPRRVAGGLAMIGTRATIRPEPRGVCLVIAPWTYPVSLALGPLVSALAAGNSVILKPSELTPRVSALLASLVAACLPAELVTVAEGDASVAETLLSFPFDHIFFTGSPAVGRLVMAAAARSLASVTLELGGKSPAVVGAGADLEEAAGWIAWGKGVNAGQTCIAPDHLFVHRSIAEPFLTALEKRFRSFYGSDPAASPDLARIVNDRHFSRLARLLDDATEKGATLRFGGARDAGTRFLGPTLIEGVADGMLIAEEEIFGPLLPIFVYDHPETVIDHVRAGPKPLALYLFDRDKPMLARLCDGISAGTVGINLTLLQFAHDGLPFGGVNMSGLGQAHGIHGFRAFSHEKPVLENTASMMSLFFPPYTRLRKKLAGLALRLFG